MKYYKINDKLVKANSLKSAIGLVKDSVASDIVKAIENMGRGFKLVNQTSEKTFSDINNTKLTFKSNKAFNNNDKERIRLEIARQILLLGFKRLSNTSFLKRKNNNAISVDVSYDSSLEKVMVIVSEHYDYYKDSNKVKDSAGSDIVTAIKNMGRGFKLVNQSSYRTDYGRVNRFIFKSNEVNNDNSQRIEKQIVYVLSKLGYKYNSALKRFKNEKNNSATSIAFSISKDTLEINFVEYGEMYSKK